MVRSYPPGWGRWKDGYLSGSQWFKQMARSTAIHLPFSLFRLPKYPITTGICERRNVAVFRCRQPLLDADSKTSGTRTPSFCGLFSSLSLSLPPFARSLAHSLKLFPPTEPPQKMVPAVLQFPRTVKQSWPAGIRRAHLSRSF